MPTNRFDLVIVTWVVLLLWGISFLSACTRPAPQHRVGPMMAVLPPQPDLCDLIRLDMLIGQDYIRLADQPLVGTLRVIWPGQEITSEIVPTRLNAQVSDQGLILGLACG